MNKSKSGVSISIFRRYLGLTGILIVVQTYSQGTFNNWSPCVIDYKIAKNTFWLFIAYIVIIVITIAMKAAKINT